MSDIGHHGVNKDCCPSGSDGDAASNHPN